jgi:hypothetical protein
MRTDHRYQVWVDGVLTCSAPKQSIAASLADRFCILCLGIRKVQLVDRDTEKCLTAWQSIGPLCWKQIR